MEFLQSPAGIAAVAVALVVVVGVIAALARRKPRWEAALEGDDPPALAPTAASAEKAPASPPAQKPKAPSKADTPPPTPGPSVFGRLVKGLSRTKAQMVSRADDLFKGRKQIDEDLWNGLEELLVTSDVGIRTTSALLESMRAQAEREELRDPQRLREILAETIRSSLEGCAGSLAQPDDGGPLVMIVVGVNGAGKTTTIGKLAARFKAEGRTVVIAAGDTFRAAAIEQVAVWGKRAGAHVVRHEPGSDPAAVAHDAVTAAIARGADVVICDTAGRLHSKTDLMQELTKVSRVVSKVRDGAPHEVLLVLDSTNGQNAIAQAREFAAAVGVTGIALTKLDGTAKGGVIIAIAHELDIPVKLIGIGEAVEDLRDFEPEAFVRALFDSDDSALGRGGNSADAAARDAALGISAEEISEASVRYQG